MSSIRPMERGDLEAVASLYERVVRSGARAPAAGLPQWFERTLFESPWSDPSIPSLVALDDRQEVIGALCSHVRHLRIAGQPARLAVSGQLVVAPEARDRAFGARLLRSYLNGPQQLTITDGATQVVRGMWERLGGDAAALQCLEWWRPLRPWRSATAAWERRRGRALSGGLSRAADMLDGATLPLLRREARRRGAPWQVDQGRAPRIEKLTSAALLAQLPAITRHLRLAPDYDAGFAEWLLAELSAVNTRGELRARLVSRADGTPLGYFIYYLVAAGISAVIAVAAPDELTGGAVLDALLSEARAAGAAALYGRVEPRLLRPLAERHAIFRYAGGALVHASEPAIAMLATSRHALLTRLEGEWWMAPHLAGPVPAPTQ